MATNIPTRPYPTIGEIYRSLAVALGTKNKNRDLDRMAREGDYDHLLRSSLLDELFREPLKKRVSAQLSELICSHLDQMISEYIKVVTTVGVDALTRAESLPLLAEHFFGDFATQFLVQVNKLFGGPSLTDYLEAQEGKAIGAVCEWLESNISSFPTFLSYQVKTQQDQYRKWKQGKELPKPTSFSVFLETFPESPDKQSILIHLTVARAVQHMLELSSENSLFEPVRPVHSKIGYKGLVNILTEANLNYGKKFAPIAPAAFAASDVLRRKYKKTASTKNDSWQLLKDFEKQMATHDPEGITGHYLVWQKAKWFVYAGQYDEAITYYKSAFGQAIYRAENLPEILKEALAVAAFKRDMVFLKQLKNQAVTFGYFSVARERDKLSRASKRSKYNVVEDWELEQWTTHFSMLFPPENCFPGCVDKRKHETEFPFLQDFDPDSYTKKPDLKRPNRIVNIGMEFGGIKRRYPQLVLYTRCNQPDNVQALLEAGADVEALSSISESALLFSLLAVVNTGDRRCFDLLKEYDHSHETMNIKTDKQKFTVLLQAIETGIPDIVDTVLTMGAEINRPGGMDDQTALNMCIKNLAILKKTPEQFIEKCRDIRPDDPVLIDSARRTSFGMLGSTEKEIGSLFQEKYGHPLNQVFQERMLEALVQQKKARLSRDELITIARMLIERGADPNATHPSPIDGYTPLMLAVENNEPELIKLMLEHNGNPRNSYQFGPRRIDCWDIAEYFCSDESLRVTGR